MEKRVFLDTCILRAAFIAAANGKDWHQEFSLPSDSFRLFTSQKCIIEMYGILKTTVLTSDLSIYGCGYSSSTGNDSLLKMIFSGDEFLNIYWHHQILEASITLNVKTNIPENYDVLFDGVPAMSVFALILISLFVWRG